MANVDGPTLTIRTTTSNDDKLVKNLLNHYLHDMAEWFKFDSDEDGFYAYDEDLESNIVFIAHHGAFPAGLALVRKVDDQFDMHEFFVLRRYRRMGTGRAFCDQIWEQLPGQWQVRVFAENKPAVPFWKEVISSYTNNQCSESNPVIDGKSWIHYHFQAGESVG